MAGATALIVSSIGGLLLIIFKSKCKTISCCWGLLNCIREIPPKDSSDEEAVIPPQEPDSLPQMGSNTPRAEPEPEPEPEPEAEPEP